MNEQLQHHGIIGQKWGVRRYRNYDGTYTKAGLKRYDDASEKLEKRKQEYKDAKSSGVRGDALKLAKSKVKAQEREVDKHYKHLAVDKRADKGKIRYNNGENPRQRRCGEYSNENRKPLFNSRCLQLQNYRKKQLHNGFSYNWSGFYRRFGYSKSC